MVTAVASNGKDMTTQEQEQYCENCGAANPVTARFWQFCATLLPFKYTTDSLPDQTLLARRYPLLRRIGQCGMGAVYQGADKRITYRPRAIKAMSSTGLTSAN